MGVDGPAMMEGVMLLMPKTGNWMRESVIVAYMWGSQKSKVDFFWYTIPERLFGIIHLQLIFFLVRILVNSYITPLQES